MQFWHCEILNRNCGGKSELWCKSHNYAVTSVELKEKTNHRRRRFTPMSAVAPLVAALRTTHFWTHQIKLQVLVFTSFFVFCASQHPFKDTDCYWLSSDDFSCIRTSAYLWTWWTLSFLLFFVSVQLHRLYTYRRIYTPASYSDRRAAEFPPVAIVSLFWSVVRLCCERGVLPVLTEPLSALLSPRERCCGSWLRVAGRRDETRCEGQGRSVSCQIEPGALLLFTLKINKDFVCFLVQ